MSTVLAATLANAAVYDARLKIGAIVIPIGVLVMVIVHLVRRRSGRP